MLTMLYYTKSNVKLKQKEVNEHHRVVCNGNMSQNVDIENGDIGLRIDDVPFKKEVKRRQENACRISHRFTHATS